MLSWWTNMESVAALNGWMLMATLVFAVLTGIMVFLTVGKLVLVDFSQLEAIWRILMFIGFGGFFLLISYYIQKYSVKTIEKTE